MTHRLPSHISHNARHESFLKCDRRLLATVCALLIQPSRSAFGFGLLRLQTDPAAKHDS